MPQAPLRRRKAVVDQLACHERLANTTGYVACRNNWLLPVREPSRVRSPKRAASSVKTMCSRALVMHEEEEPDAQNRTQESTHNHHDHGLDNHDTNPATPRVPTL